jgi:RNA polymerase sigma-70 factor (ECF subfamily)
MDCPYSELSSELSEIVRKKVRRLTRTPRDSAVDADDVRQALYLKLHQALPKFRADCGKVEAFAQTAMDREAASLQRRAVAGKRRGKPISLQIVITLPSGEHAELAQAISERERASRIGLSPRTACDAIDLSADLSQLLAAYSPADQKLLRRLMKQSVAEISREMGVPESTLHSRVRRFRQVFEAESMREYLQ